MRKVSAWALCGIGVVVALGCAQILGFDERSVSAPDDAQPGDETATDGAMMSPSDAGDAADAPMLTQCGDAAVDLTSDPNHCGSCTNVCPDPDAGPNTVAACTASVCGAGCDVGWAHCDKTSPGCEHDVSGDPANCGACNHVCGGKNVIGGMGVCKKSACVFNCSPGTAHCSSDDSTGCETTVATDQANCGSCGFSCGSAMCNGGYCQFTTSGEAFTRDGTSNLLLQDSVNLYWENDTAYTGAIRAVGKDGKNLQTLFGSPTVGAPYPGAALALDKNYLYWFNDTYEHDIYRGVKTAAQDAGLVDHPPSGGASGIAIDTDGTKNASYVYAYGTNGLSRTDISAASSSVIDMGSVSGAILVGTNLYYGVASTNGISYFDVTAKTPTVKSLTTISSLPRAFASDGTSLFVLADDTNIYKVDIGSATTTTFATGGPGQGQGSMTCDGVSVYVAAGSLYKFPIAGGGKFSSYVHVDGNTLPTASKNISAVAVDGTAVYFASYLDVFSTRK